VAKQKQNMKVTVLVCLLVLFLVSTAVFGLLAFASPLAQPIPYGPGMHAKPRPESEFPKVIHLMYLPYDSKTQKLKANQDDFDHTFYNKLTDRVRALGWTTRMWTYEALRAVVAPKLFDFVCARSTRPIQIVDFFRVWCVWTFGGISLQYNSEIADLQATVPTQSDARFFVYRSLDAQSSLMHGGKLFPCEISNQLFSGYPGATFFEEVLLRNLINLAHMKVASDIDVLCCGGPFLFTTVFFEIPERNYELCQAKPQGTTFTHMGSWRGKKCPWELTPWTPGPRMTLNDAKMLLTNKQVL
jgi:hypothetical protein